MSDNNPLPTAEECVNLGALYWPSVYASPEAEQRYTKWLERNGVRCTSCNLVILTPYGPLTAEHMKPNAEPMQCDKCFNAS